MSLFFFAHITHRSGHCTARRVRSVSVLLFRLMTYKNILLLKLFLLKNVVSTHIEFQQVLIVGVYLTLVTTIPSTALSAPTGLMEESTPKPPRWHNPCGKSEHYGAPISTNGLYQPKLDSLIVAVKKAIFDLNRMKSNLVSTEE